MSKKEKRWRRVYNLMIVMYFLILLPLAIFDYYQGGEFPLAIVVMGLALPGMKANHINLIRKKEGNQIL